MLRKHFPEGLSSFISCQQVNHLPASLRGKKLFASRLTQNDTGQMKPTQGESVFHHENVYLQGYTAHASSNLLYKILFYLKLNIWNKTAGNTKMTMRY